MRRTSLALFAVLLLAPILRADNYVRSVRVSWVEGDVQMRSSDTAQPAIPNMPIIEGMAFTTGSDGVLEIELEDGSTVRLTPDSALRIPELVTSDQGAHRSTFELQRGTAYIDFKHHGDDEVYFRFPGHDIRLNRSVRLRAEVAASEAQVAVFDGEFEVRGPDEPVKVKKNETISLGLGDDAAFVLTKSIAPAPYDDWNHQLQQTADQYTSSSNNGNFWSRLFGTGYNGGNLNYYGQTYYLPTYGWVWQPYYLTGAPCTTGYWQWYPGWGWTFISSSPWGWGTCNYGAWNYVPVRGWVWCPPRHHHHHLWANWSPTPRWGTVPPGFVSPGRPKGTPDGHAGPTFLAQGNVPANPRQLDRDDRDPRRSIHPPVSAHNNLAGSRSTSSDSTAAGSTFVTTNTGVSPSAGFMLNGGPRSVNELRRELGGRDGGPAIPLHIVKQGVLHRGAPPASMLQSSPGKTSGTSATTTTDVRRSNDNNGHFHNQLGTTTTVTTPRDSRSSSQTKNNSGSSWRSNSGGSSNNSTRSNSGSSYHPSGGSSHPSGGSSYHPSGGGSSYHPSSGGGGSSHSGGGGGGGGGGGHSGGSSSSSSSSGSHSGKH